MRVGKIITEIITTPDTRSGFSNLEQIETFLVQKLPLQLYKIEFSLIE